MKIYTKSGDDGTTGLFGGGRVPKHHVRVEAYGEVDEINSHLGLARAHLNRATLDAKDGQAQASLKTLARRLAEVQSDLLTLGAQLASSRPPVQKLREADVAQLEAWIDESEQALPALTNFILPGGSQTAAALHLCRTVCRRAERATWRAVDEAADVQPREEAAASEGGGRRAEPVAPEALLYLNRLSDLLFTWARLVNHHLQVADTVWAPRSDS